MAEQNNSNYFVPDFGDGGSGKTKKVKNHPKSARIIWIIAGALAVVMGIIVFSMDSGSRTDDIQTAERRTTPPAIAEVKPAVGPFSDSEAIRERIYRNMREQILLEAAASSDSMILAAPITELMEPKRNVRVVVKPPSEALIASRQMASAAFTAAPGVEIAGMVTASPQAAAGGAQAGVTGDTLGELMTSYEEALSDARGTSGAGETGPALSGAAGEGAGIAQGRDAAADSNASAMAHQDRANTYAAANTNTGAAQGEYLSSTRRAPVSKYELKAGSVISGVMVGGINSDLPGTILGQVTQNVYDTATGAHILIPQGARMVGAYDSHVVYGQSRLLVVWNRIIFPDGTSLNLEGMLGSDQRGYAGFKQKVDHHYSRMIGAAIFASVFVAAGKEATKDDKSTATDTNGNTRSTESIFAESVMENVTNIATQMIEKNLNIAPTLRILPGFRFSIITAKDVAFAEPYAVPGGR